MEMPPIRIKFIILNQDGTKHHSGSFNFNDANERRACAERFNECLLQGYTITTTRVRK